MRIHAVLTMSSLTEKEIKMSTENQEVEVNQYPEKPLVRVKLVGTDGNVFALMALCRRALVKSGYAEESNRMIDQVTKSSSYSEALRIMTKYVDAR